MCVYTNTLGFKHTLHTTSCERNKKVYKTFFLRSLVLLRAKDFKKLGCTLYMCVIMLIGSLCFEELDCETSCKGVKIFVVEGERKGMCEMD